MTAGDNPTRPSLVSAAAAGHPFAVPWSHKEVALLAGFESGRILQQEGPWVLGSPFVQARTDTQAVVQFDADGGTISYRDALSSRAESSTEHLSVELGVTVEIPFASANVTGKYDKTVTENEHGTQASRNSTCRLGRVVVTDFPDFSEEAQQLLRRPDGRAQFREVYGDFFLYGYTLGADAGACLSAHSHSKTETERTQLTVTVKVLFVEKSATTIDVKSKSMSETSLVFSGYNTIAGEAPSLSLQTPAPNAVSMFGGYGKASAVDLQARISDYMTQIRRLEESARMGLRKLNLKDGERVPLTRGPELCRSGMVVQLLLFPYARLQQYITAIPGKFTAALEQQLKEDTK